MRAVALMQHRWAEEPEPPAASLDKGKFAGALAKLCNGLPLERAERYAAWIVESAQTHGEDPFLLAALVHRMSQCRSDFSNAQGAGLTALSLKMLKKNVSGRMLRYPVYDHGILTERVKALSTALTETSVRNPQTNIEWGAAVLSMWREQHEALDSNFEHIEHRHYVSHFIWGDKVPSPREEDRVFTDRRRLLGYYGEKQPERTVAFRNVLWGSPLEAGPRVVSSAPGASRDEGMRRHRGVDVESVLGEPVLAMADGVVFFAGIDMPGAGARALSPREAKRVPSRRMGRGGRFVCIDHGPSAKGRDEAFLQTCYMHLEDLNVQSGDVVTRGQPIGTVGRTGCKHSPPHLHLEFKSDKRRYDARDIVPGILIGEPPFDPPPKRRRGVPRV